MPRKLPPIPSLTALTFLVLAAPAWAQVTSDGTIGTTVTPTGATTYTITGGQFQGTATLLHSFGDFSLLNTTDTAHFDLGNASYGGAANGVNTVIGRVTGGNPSTINGQIQLTGGNSPDLFLINPSGFVFGAGASLNVPGSFVASTAENVLFANNVAFGIGNTPDPLLTITAPTGLQLGNPAPITVQGAGHQLQELPGGPVNRSGNPVGLRVDANETLALIGGPVNFSGGVVGVTGGGHLEVGSVSTGQVGLNATGQGWVGDYAAVSQFNDIQLAQQSLLDASGNNGSIQLQGRNINLTEGSATLIQNLGTQSSEGITVRATNALNLVGNTTDDRLGSQITIENLGLGAIGDVTIAAGQLSVQDGGRINIRTYTSAPSGNIAVNVADTITIDGFAPANARSLSSIATSLVNNPSNQAGNISISTGNLSFLNGGVAVSTAIGMGQSGTIQVNATGLIDIVGNNPITLAQSGITTVTIGTGNANNTTINTARLSIREGGFLGSATLASGSAGNVTINASESVDIQGRAAGSIVPSRISSAAEILDPITQFVFGLPAIPTGNAGSVAINTPSLQITDGAAVSVKNDGPGIAGGVQISADTVFLNNQGRLTAVAQSGEGGNIALTGSNALVLRNESLISATAGGTGNGGNITLNIPVIAGFENSDIIANAVQGNGGNITITTQGIFGLEFRPQLTPENDITASSQFGVNGTVEINEFSLDPDTGIVELPSGLADASDQVAQGCGAGDGSSFIATGRGGIPDSPNEIVSSDLTWSDTRDLSAFFGPAQSNSAPTEQTQDQTPTLTEINAWRINPNGQVELITVNADASPSPVTYATCSAPTLVSGL